MTARLATLVAHDARLQYRFGIYAAYAVVIALYVGFLASTGAYLPNWVPAMIVFVDPAAVGFFFLGALMLLERSENVRLALAATPLLSRDYVASKAATLTVMALVATFALVPFIHASANLPLLALSVALVSFAYIGIGVAFARRFRTVNAYLIGSGALLTPVIIPGFAALFPNMPLWVALVPSAAQFRLILVAMGAMPIVPAELGLCLAVAALSAVAALVFAVRDMRQEFGK